MSLSWIRERAPLWDEDKARIVGDAPAGVFDSRYKALVPGAPVPGEWWRVEDDGRVVGYGWLEIVWGDAEVLLAVAPEDRGRGVGAFILERLEDEAQARGLNYLTNIVRPTHPEAEKVSAWLVKRGFKASEDG
ncbi:MAG: GNAT family N-acetyltransferase, partial [Planctomycetota bacterium]